MSAPNFIYLRETYPILFNLAQSAECNLYLDPVVALFKIRQFGEKLSELLFNEHKLQFPSDNNFHSRLKTLDFERILPGNVKDLFFSIKLKGNEAVHNNKGSLQDAKQALFYTFKISKWFYETYVEHSIDVAQLKFHLPEQEDTNAIELLETQYKELEARFEQLLNEREVVGITKEQTEIILKRSEQVASKIDMSEAETRELIDEQLRMAGWEVNSMELNNKTNKTLPERGRNIAIAEWPVEGGWADYALFIGKELYGIAEAKKYALDISTDLRQAKVYAEKVEALNETTLLGKWGAYKVPFLFSTNGRSYLKQIETKSGVWFLDVREQHNNARALQGWYSPEGLEMLYKQDIKDADAKIENASLAFLQDKAGLSLRDYQIEAIKEVEKNLVSNPDNRRWLIAMATGTGKTRTIIGLCYHLIQTNRFKRILFLVDRRLLGTQAINNFKDYKVAGLNTFADIYDIKELKDKIPKTDTRLHFATVQSLVKRIFYSENPTDIPPVDQYDCIIVDEAHRGYLLDREMDDEELGFKNQQDYISKYRMVLDYFDAYAIGLTATPALHTKEIFGPPIYYYTYRNAVIDGYLIDHEPPYIIKTRQSEDGIKWERGEKPKVYDKESNTVTELSELQDELNVEVSAFNKSVLTPEFNRTVVTYLASQLDPDGDEKTLIFAATDPHADEVVSLLKEAFRNIGAHVPDNTIQKITGKSYDPEEQVNRLKNEKYPNIAVTVDLLTTGIDVPAICNIVFMRRVRSRILYEQMLGRATRLCDEIGKKVFRIYDAVRIYETLEDYTNMKPVVVNPNTTFKQLVDELALIETDARLRIQVEQVIAKLQGKKRQMNEAQIEQFTYNSGGMSPSDFIQALKTQPIAVSINTLKGMPPGLWKFLDEWRSSPSHMLVSEHEDEYITTERGYGKGTKPEDYLLHFEQFIKENLTRIAALNIICTRPKSLTRKELRDLLIELDQQGYNERWLKSAWKDAKNEDIAADIISFIRTLAIGETLISHEQRIKNAVDTVRNRGNWNTTQQKWLDRIELQLLAETVLQPEDFDKSPFSDAGGFKRLDNIFEHQLGQIIDTINDNLYIQTA
jgi:type I restriction enzyme, R subunit